MEEAGVLTPELIQQLDNYLTRLRLQQIRRNRPWWFWPDVWFRSVSVLSGFVFFGLLSPAPLMCLRWMDDGLMAIGAIDPFQQLSEALKRFITGKIHSLLISWSVSDISSDFSEFGGNLSSCGRTPERFFQRQLRTPHIHSRLQPRWIHHQLYLPCASLCLSEERTLCDSLLQLDRSCHRWSSS